MAAAATDYVSWIGRQAVTHDVCDAGRAQRLAATLGHAEFPWRPGLLPPLGHWLCFVPDTAQGQLSGDGHPQRTGEGILPDVDLPRRMWAGSRIRFLQPIPLDTPLTRTSTLIAATLKQGRSGPMLLATVRHEVAVTNDETALVEEQDIVYREAGASVRAPRMGAVGKSDPIVRSITPDPILLFRYSALTFNAHRIHYDQDYAHNVEQYPGLVVQGPLIATLLLDHLLRANPKADLRTFEFRAESPLFANEAISLGLKLESDIAELRAIGPAGVAMRARALLAT